MSKHKIFMFQLTGRFVVFPQSPLFKDRKNVEEHVLPLFLAIIDIACTILRFPVGGGRITEPFHNMLIKCRSLEIILPLRTTRAYSVK